MFSITLTKINKKEKRSKSRKTKTKKNILTKKQPLYQKTNVGRPK